LSKKVVITSEIDGMFPIIVLGSHQKVGEFHFYRGMLCIARTVLSQDVQLSVCLSHASILSKQLNISSHFFNIG